MSTIARIQQVATLSLAGAALAWWASHAAGSPLRAAGGALAILLGYTVLLALQFAFLRTVGREPAVAPASPATLLHAWARECVHAVRVFAWRQPFRWKQPPDELPSTPGGPRGVVLVHGFYCNRGFWAPWLHRLRSERIPFIAVNLEPAFGSIDTYAPILNEAILRMTAATGRPPWVVCHSMGGLAVRAWRRTTRASVPVHHVVTIGTPHRGTWLAHFSHMRNAREMRLGSDWLRQLAADEAALPAPTPWTCWWGDCDNIAFPVTTGTLDHADNRRVAGAPHVGLAFDARVVEATLAMIHPYGERT